MINFNFAFCLPRALHFTTPLVGWQFNKVMVSTLITSLSYLISIISSASSVLNLTNGQLSVSCLTALNITIPERRIASRCAFHSFGYISFILYSQSNPVV